MYENVHHHERLNSILNLMNGLIVSGFNNCRIVSSVMSEIANLDQDMLRAEQEAAKKAAEASRPDEGKKEE